MHAHHWLKHEGGGGIMKADQVCLFESGAPVPLLTRKAQKFPTPLAISFPTTFPRKAGEIGKMGGNGGKWGQWGNIMEQILEKWWGMGKMRSERYWKKEVLGATSPGPWRWGSHPQLGTHWQRF